MKKILIVFGTRPEAIKCCPVIIELRTRKTFHVKVCVTGQHREMIRPILDSFNVIPDYDFAVMRKEQTLFDLTSLILINIKPVLEKEKPDFVLVQGDTTTAFIASLACFYLKIKIGHIEAGLRTNDIYSPFPEEFNRQAIGLVARYHFAPTEISKKNLINEGKNPKHIFVTGNTAIDALKTTVRSDYSNSLLEWSGNRRLIVLTAHRRENWGKPLERIFRSIKRVADNHPDIAIVFPAHLNPAVREPANKLFLGSENIKIIEPLDVVDFHNIISRSYLILTDSGGIQEEAPSLGKPVLVMRNTTERPEGVESGALRLTGADEESIFHHFTELLADQSIYLKMSQASNPYGDGNASKKIADILEEAY